MMANTLYTYDLTHTTSMPRGDARSVRRIWDEAHLVSSIQGLVNRKSPRLYLIFVGSNGSIDKYWLGEMQAKGEWLADVSTKQLPDLKALINTFRADIKGLVVYDEQVPATSNVASTIAGVEGLACIRYDSSADSLYHWLSRDTDGPRLPVRKWLVNPDGTSLFTGKGLIPSTSTPSTGSAKCDAYIWAKINYLDTGRCNPTSMGYYIDAWWLRDSGGEAWNHTLTNHDYFIARKGFIFDLSPWDDEVPNDDPTQPVGTDTATLKQILLSAWKQTGGKKMIHVAGFLPWDKKYTNFLKGASKHEPVPGEWRYAEILSSYNAYMDADALGYSGMANASVYSLFPLKKKYPQNLPTEASLTSEGFMQPNGKPAAKRFVSLYVGDYDSAAWLYHRMPELWNDADRGKIKLGWAINPNLAQRFAFGMAWMRKKASDNDLFLAGDSGAGYINPGHLAAPRSISALPSGVRSWEEHCKKYFQQWDISMVGFVIDGFAPAMNKECLDAYMRFCTNGLVAQKLPRRCGIHNGKPYLTMEWDLGGGPTASARTISEHINQSRERFFIFRTILWSPHDLKLLVDTVKSDPACKDVEFVDPYSLMMLIKKAYTK